ncbi:uncharacterized protein LOC131253114 isoform X2 [Magnolia sinica]|uniref:uncharacterized protein LOC131253114 isoform X2 n=1 Tax=Magnolia sinica TaxID=86752 RepID=UPI00265A2279|nr:uncharacterized protein LOC131253114 isoform X2 [Magnolia sinica]
MAIVKNYSDFSPGSGDTIYSDDDDELQTRSSASDSGGADDDDDDDDVDSGMGSDECDLSELGQIGEEFCRVGDQSCSVPYELYDLPDLGGVLSLDTWNDCLTEDERFRLAEFLPDMDRETFVHTLKDLFSGGNFHFGSPLVDLFSQLKGGFCEPRVACYQQGLNYFEKRTHYHALFRYQNSMVGSLIQMRDAWENCAGYGIEERIRILNLVRSRRSLMYEKDGGLGSEMETSAREESGDGFWTKRSKISKVGAKMGHKAVYTVKSPLDFASRGRQMVVEPTKYGKPNPKGILKVATQKASSKEHAEVSGRLPFVNHGLEPKSTPFSALAPPRRDRVVGYDLGNVHQSRNLLKDDEDDGEEEYAYSMGFQSNRNMVRDNLVARVKSSKVGKKHEFEKYDTEVRMGLHKEDTEGYLGLPSSGKNENLHSRGRNMNVKQLTDMGLWTGKPITDRTSYDYHSRDARKKAKYPEKLQRSLVEDRRNLAKDQADPLLLKGTRADWSARSQTIQQIKTQDAFAVDQSVKFDDWNVRSKKWKTREDFPAGKTLQEHIRRKSAQNGGMNREDLSSRSMYSQSEETESDSSEHLDEDEDIDPSMRKLGYPSGVFQGGRSSLFRAVDDPKKVNKLVRKDEEHGGQILDGVKRSSIKMGDLRERRNMPEIERYSSKVKQKGRKSECINLHEYGAENLEGKTLSASSKLVDDRKQIYMSSKNGQIQGRTQGVPVERSQLPSLKTYSVEKKRKLNAEQRYSVPLSNNIHKYGSKVLEEDNLHAVPKLTDDQPRNNNRAGKKGQNAEGHVTEPDFQPLLGCSSVARKRKGKADLTYLDGPDNSNDMQSSSPQPIDEPNITKKRGKKKVEAESSPLPMATSDAIISERGTTDLEPETKPPKKPFTLITPSIHTGFSFSIVHLLSAVRIAMITLHAEDTSEVGKHLGNNDGRQKPKNEEQNKKLEGVNGVRPSHDNLDVNYSEHTGQKNLPSLTVQEIVNRVRSNPGDPCILETQEPLQDLVRGVLKIFSSKTAPLGAKGWKALVLYEKSTKSWSWVGPVSSNSSDRDTIEEVTSAEAWGVPHKMLVKLVDAFANWLKSGQETLQQIGSLPPPPMSLMLPDLDEKERFKDLRAQKSLTTISPSSDEVRAYFRREELLRYSVPDRAFSYTAADGRKSIVAPLRRCGGKPSSKPREHFMLKTDRPPHVTILCLVRDAAARLPGSIGTRADVCTLIRDSQYIVEDVTDAQVNQIVSGALDRLHYERDPCVLFDGERKLWVYLHRDREEEDFEDDGTSSTKKWKRQRKDTTEQSDLGAGNDVGFQGEKTELVYNDLRPNMEESIEPFIDSAQGSMHQGHPMGWEVLDLNALRENKMLCQENSTNEDFDDDTFGKERPGGLLSASLM